MVRDLTVRIEGDGTPLGTRLLDDEGREIANVSALTLKIAVGKPSELTLVLMGNFPVSLVRDGEVLLMVDGERTD